MPRTALKQKSSIYATMLESIKKNGVFVVGILLIGGIAVYWFAGRGNEEELPAEGLIDQPSQFAAVRAEILGTIATLQAVRLDISVLDDPAFRSLTEAPQPPDTPFTVGKRNPFEP